MSNHDPDGSSGKISMAMFILAVIIITLTVIFC
jgi:hypothetical protein